MGQELKGDATMDAMAVTARFHRMMGLNPRYDNPEAMQSWLNFVQDFNRGAHIEPAKEEE